MVTSPRDQMAPLSGAHRDDAHMSSRWLAALAFVTIGALGLACSRDIKTTSADVVASDFRFQPTAIQSRAGRSIVLSFRNDGRALHNFSVPAVGVDVDAKRGKRGKARIRVSQPGTLEFFCKYHRDRGMTGTIQVRV